MDGGLVLHGADETEVVSALADVGEEFGDGEAGLAVVFEFPGGGEEGFELDAMGGGDVFGDGVGAGFAVEILEGGFGVEGVDLGDAAAHEEDDDGFGGGVEMRAGSGSQKILF